MIKKFEKDWEGCMNELIKNGYYDIQLSYLD